MRCPIFPMFGYAPPADISFLCVITCCSAALRAKSTMLKFIGCVTHTVQYGSMIKLFLSVLVALVLNTSCKLRCYIVNCMPASTIYNDLNPSLLNISPVYYCFQCHRLSIHLHSQSVSNATSSALKIASIVLVLCRLQSACLY